MKFGTICSLYDKIIFVFKKQLFLNQYQNI